MKPPVFLWKSGSLDVFDSVAELQQRYSAEALLESDVALYDGTGRRLTVCAEFDGSSQIRCDEHPPTNPDALVELLRRYAECGGLPAETVQAMTLAELIEEAYPSSNRSIRSPHAATEYRPIKAPARLPDSEPDIRRLFHAFAVAVVGGAITACIALWMAASHFKSQPSLGSYYGAIREAIIGVAGAAIAGALIGGIALFLGTLFHFNLFRQEMGRSIGCAFLALFVLLVVMGTALSALLLSLG
jgi:hypothetical protein